MAQIRPLVFFFRCLDTAGNEGAQVGPFSFGRFSKHFERVFVHSLDFVPVLGMGGGPLEEQAQRAKDFLSQHPAFIKACQNSLSFHFLGHSAGGLVAKMLAQDPLFQSHLKSLITIGSPHQGSFLAREASQFAAKHPLWNFLFSIFGYDFKEKKSTFESIEQLAHRRFQWPSHLFTGSVVCSSPPHQWSWFYRLLHLWPGLSLALGPSDGLIEQSSQAFGQKQWLFQLDHAQQIGFGANQKEFLELCSFLENLWKDSDWTQSFLSREISFKASFSSEREADS